MNQNERILREGSFPKLLLQLCIPSIVIMVVMVLYNMADVFFIGKLGDPYMIAAVGLAGPVFSILSGFGTLFGSGGCTVISLALGGNDRQRARQASAICFYGALIFGVIYAVLVLSFLRPICSILGADAATMDYTYSYLRVITIFAPISIFSNVFLNLIRADGAAKESMVANVLGTVTNIVLDPLFILVFRWGVSGAALATGLGNIVSSIVILRYMHSNADLYSIHLSDAKWKKDIVISVFTLGLPMAFSTILMSVSSILSNHLLVSYDSIAVAAQGVAGKIGMLNSMIAMGICIGMQPAISYHYASGNRERTVEILKKTCLTTVSTGVLISAFSFLFRDTILTAFIDDPKVIAIGRVALLASVAVGPVYGIYQMATTYFQSTGQAGYATVCSLLNKGLIYIPVLFLLKQVFGMYGILFTGAVTDGLSLLAAVLMVLRVIRMPEKPVGERQTAEQAIT